MLPESDCRFDRELVEWFSRRRGAWSGTATALLASLRTSTGAGSSLSPQSPVELYTHLQSHRQILQSLGVDVMLHNGVPRMVSLRSSQDEPQRKAPSNTSDYDRNSGSVPSSVTASKVCSPDSANAVLGGSKFVDRDTPPAKSDSPAKFAASEPAERDGPRDGFFLNTGEALFAIVEMRRQVRERGLNLEETVDLVIGRAQEITRGYGIAVGFLPQEIGFRPRTGAAVSSNKLAFDANLFQSRLVAGESVQITDAQKHPLLGATYRREGVGSLIMVPIFRHREVAGAMEFFFQEQRSFSPGDVMDLGLIAGVISESLGGSKNPGIKLATAPGKSAPNVKLVGDLLNLDPVHSPPGPNADTIDSKTLVAETSDPERTVPAVPPSKLPSASAQLWFNVKRAWTRQLGRL
jgi:hypothetical protein